MSLFTELKQRNVFRVAAAYAVVAWVLLQVVSVVEPALHLPDWSDTLVTILALIGFPIALVMAWVYELTPAGIRRTTNLPPGQRAPQQAQRRMDIVIIGVLVLALGYFVTDKFFMSREAAGPAGTGTTASPQPAVAEAPDKSIAVLPFDNRSDRPEDAFFVDGIHDDLLTRIAAIKDIKTISRTSVMAYRGTEKNLRTIGQELGVSSILEGGVQRAGNQVRVNLQLIDARTDAHLWAETYTRELTAENIFQIQSEITAAVAGALEVILTDEEQQRLDKLPTQNLEALEAYFRGRRAFAEATAQGYDEGILQFQRAAGLDPGFAAAWSGQGHAMVDLIWYRGLNAQVQLAKARPLIDRAIELDPESSAAWNALGKWHQFAGEIDDAEAAYARATDLGPNNAYAWADWGNLALWQRRDALVAIERFRKAVDLDPNNLGVLTQLAEAMGAMGLGDDAISLLEVALAGQPGHAGAWRVLAQLQADSQQRLDEAIRSMRRAMALDPVQPWIAQRLAEFHAKLEAYEPAAFWIDRAVALAPDSMDAPVFRGLAHVYRGETESALSEFRNAGPGTDGAAFARYNLTLHEGRSGKSGPAIAAFEAAHPDFTADPPVITPLSAFDAASYCWMLAATGQAERAQAVCRGARENLLQVPLVPPKWPMNFLARVNAVLGDREAMLAAMAAWVEAGNVTEWGLEPPHFDAWRDDPDFARLVATVRERQAEQKANVARWEAAGELAPVPPLPAE